MVPTATEDDGRITRTEYEEEIRQMAQIVAQRLEDDPGAEVTELVFEEVDSHQWVIYTKYYTEVLDHTEPEEWSHLVANDESDHNQVLQAMAFSAMRSDLYDELHDMNGVEV